MKEKFKYYDLFKYKSQTKMNENCENEENDSKEPEKDIPEFDSPDKSEIIGNISCSENEFKIDNR